MNKVTVTKSQMEAIERQREVVKNDLSTTLSFSKMNNFCKGSEPINNMTTEQIVLAWHGHVEVEKEYVSFDEAMKIYDEGHLVSFHHKIGSKITGPFGNKLKDARLGDYSLDTLRKGNWMIEGDNL